MTQAVLFDVLPKPGHVDQYFEMAAQLKPIVQQNPGFLSV
jgi:heme-degrading monooxygenase HmoA